MYAYIDESGNTGTNLFDPDQPSFLNVAMSSPVDFDSVFQKRVSRIARTAGVNHLHASELGMEGVESIAREIIELVDFSQARFYFAFVNKPDVAVMKFFDAVFDPGVNPAAPHHTYVTRFLKFLLLMKFSAILTEESVQRFWSSMISPHSPKAERSAIAAIESVLQRVKMLPDVRSRQLIGDTLSWAKDNIGELAIWTPRKRDRYGHLPNLFTFPALMTGIRSAADVWGSKIDLIVHDQQGQFGTTLHEWHSLFRGFEPEMIIHFGDTPIEFADIRDSQFETRDSRNSAGLQVVDIILWTFARVSANKPLGMMSMRLFERCFSRDDIYIMSLSWVRAEVEITMDAVMGKPLTQDQLQEGKRLLEVVEQMRQSRMAEARDSKS